MTDRAQTFTLESVAAALLLLGSVVFVTQAAGITPLTASTASQQVPEQQHGVAVGVLDAAFANGSLRSTLLYWDESDGAFHRTEDERYYVAGGPPTAFGELLNETFGDRAVTFNVDIVYTNASGEQERVPMVRQGTPSDDAVRATRTVTLYDDDALLDASGNSTNTTLESVPEESFYAPDAAPDSPVYNVVRVEVVVWSV
ncbi:hypothetical protein E6P09_16595 (plasmid) [Haloferax mediterranei ATCC 33500]|uniref:Uncharacterized protein n=1 Tax=Haloferax mediterranei (strain ATCC 33500 / DSM 1411 / JCM 8866 / NBRC 14739 / NCIMB 2177 / R-4) TaxID=523841 RepID=I3RAX4_HALMT|nr:hypothetical protein [Haloferax mediterranei]AFK21384.1 hypothetical protein HFX_6262 [Haloferax mediterranei ATCC 33500]AHZ24542.1 hypothetical protein BM92_16675 [Haloferax mediterranei ATCC 33500]ELZ97293.1 hypothetical protein C439_18263 [Haloferax mediterranei ATCC 33500]MDX5990405.1 hypothetical protein [Haloferax mediterranei ATCC 33500]QCQ76938.1 hypothetical protein E6P09_16595 [Haloferax mediterranei ATCC 33500]